MTTRHLWLFIVLLITMSLSPFSCATRSARVLYSGFLRKNSNAGFIIPAKSLSSETKRPINRMIPAFRGAPRQRLLSTLACSTSVPLWKGANVHATVNDETVRGVIKEVCGSGWYVLQVASSNDIVKVRGTQLSLAATPILPSPPPGGPTASIATDTPSTQEKVASNTVPPPTIIDIDAALQSMQTDPVTNKQDLLYLQQCKHHASIQQWIMFTDLHCASSTIDTCLQVLRKVHTEAAERNAGVLFLGDFWHHRATIRVDLLNTVLQEFSKWQVPLVMIPGNHDQVTLGGHNHGLTPLEKSYRIQVNDTSSINGPLVFSHPTKFMNALFIPHIRDNTIMESVLTSSTAEDAGALFVHADVTGAYMNDLIVSTGGVPPSLFPPNKPIYSGHFHKPHAVTRGNVCIDYIGSPYETSLAEAQQKKSLLVLDASDDWKCVERIPLDIGRKHYRATSVEELEALNTTVVKSGDRVVVKMGKDELEQERRQVTPGNVSTIDAQIKTLRKAGAVVEVREVPMQAVGPLTLPNENVEELTPQSTLAAFFTEEVRRESMKNDTAEELLKAGLVLLDELELSEDLNDAMDSSKNMTDLTLESVTLQGFGSFKDQVTYPLQDRGLVLVRGINKDGGGDSNGSGKSSLAMATLWALTGTLDPRPMQDAKVSDVVNDDSKSARVSVRGLLNDKPFVITRTKTSKKGSLVFYLDGEDLTTQSIKDTQAIIDENLGVGSQIVARTMFHGQFAMNGLLEATDAKFKEELSLVVPLSMWQEGATKARAKSREASKKSAEFEGMIQLRSSDIDELTKRRDEAEAKASTQEASFERIEEQIANEVREIREAAGAHDVDVDSVQAGLEETTSKIQVLESQLNDFILDRDSALAELQIRNTDVASQVNLKREELQSKEREYDRAILKLDSATASRQQVTKKWNLDITSDAAIDMVPPEVCPTCNQPISSTGSGHSHEEMQRIAKDEIDDVVQSLAIAENGVRETTAARDLVAEELAAVEITMKESMAELEQARSQWTEKITAVEMSLADARNEQAKLSSQMTSAAKAMQQEVIINSKESLLLDERKALEATQSVYQDLCSSVNESETRLQELHASGEEQRSLSVTMKNLVDIFGPRGVQTFLLQNAIETLQTISQVYLDELSDGSQRLELKLDAGDRISRRAMIRGPNGDFVERPLSSLSGGQWRRCSLALSLGFADLVAKRGRMKTSLCVLDEPLTHLDRSGRSRVGTLLRALLHNDKDDSPISLHGGMEVSTILVILQDLAAEELEESFDHIDEVVKMDGISTVSIDE